MSQQRSEKVALITGANKGIGFETARQLGEQGIRVLVGSRNQHQGEQAAAVIVRLATLPPEGATGMFFGQDGELPW